MELRRYTIFNLSVVHVDGSEFYPQLLSSSTDPFANITRDVKVGLFHWNTNFVLTKPPGFKTWFNFFHMF